MREAAKRIRDGKPYYDISYYSPLPEHRRFTSSVKLAEHCKYHINVRPYE